MSTGQIAVETLSADRAAAELDALGELLHACVGDGASIGFVLPHTFDDCIAFWASKVLPAVAAGTRVLLVATAEGQVAGSVQLNCDTPANQPHRAEVTKLLVHPRFRRRGIARALMVELERRADERGRRLITLDTRTGDNAEPLYRSLGYETVGVIPGYALDPFREKFDPTTVMYKMLAEA